MKNNGLFLKILSIILSFCFVISLSSPQMIYAESSKYDNMTLEEKQAAIEEKIKKADEKISSLNKESKNTETYINTLDEKIKYLKESLDLSTNKLNESKNKITSLKTQYQQNEYKIEQTKKEINNNITESEKLQSEIDEDYKKYCIRLRALYVSGNTSALEVLLTSGDISSLFSRLEMIKAVSKSDTKLLKTLKTKFKELKSIEQKLKEKQLSLKNEQNELKQMQNELNQTITNLELQKTEYKEKENEYKKEKEKSDQLLTELHKQTKTYSEYRNQDQAELNEINAEIEAAAKKYQQELENKKHETTTKPSSNDDSNNGSSNAETSTTKPSNNKLTLTYPVPSQTKITCGYGSAGYTGHTGVDFSCASGSRVVAAESGTVIISTDLTNSNGSYRSYGRYIVIMHDKKNASGDYVYTLYAHNSSRIVSAGTHVKKGQLIAYSGSTGNSTGPHCHFEVRTPTAAYRNCVNPTNYLP